MRLPTEQIVCQPSTADALLRGIAQIVAPLRATLGPLARVVAVESEFPAHAPELLDSGGSIARRIVQLRDRRADPGAMLVRGLVCRLQDSVGDGTATAAVIFERVFRDGVKMLAAGCNAMLLRRSLEDGLQIILDTLTKLSFPIQGAQQLAHLAEAVCHDAALAARLGEIMDVLGEYGRVELRRSYSRELRHEFVPGTYWKSGAASPHLLNSAADGAVTLENPAILITDMDIQTPQQLLPALEAALLADYRGMVIVAAKYSDDTLGFLVANDRAGHFRTLAARPPDDVLTRPEALEDMATLTGGRVILGASGDSLADVTAADLGSAQQVYLDKEYLGIIDGKADPGVRSRRERALLRAYECAEDSAQRSRLLERLSRYVDGSATLWIGGATERQIEARKELAERAVRSLRSALREGVVPGGGVALLKCREALQARLVNTNTAEERAAQMILLEALAAPFRTIVANAGFDPHTALTAVNSGMDGEWVGFDVRSGQPVDMIRAGILDPAAVCKAAVHTAISSAALALTIDVIVHRSHREAQVSPE